MLNENFILKKIGNEYMIIPTNNKNVNVSKIFNTNETGAFIFNNLKENKSLDEILDLLKKEYNATEEILKKDLYEFIEELKKRGIYND